MACGTSDKDHDGCCVEEGDGGLDGSLCVFPQPSIAANPSEEAFDDPSLWLDREAIGSKEGFTVSNFRFVALALIAGFISLNIIGFCYEKISFFTNGRLIEIGIDRVLSDERNTIPSDITTAEQFLDTFKDCCSASSGQNPIESVLPLILGIRETRVDIGYTFSRDGKTYISDTTFFVNCCGIVGERWHDTQKM